MESVFVLQHCYENEDGYDEVKFIGVYATKERAEKTIEMLKNVLGFCDYPVDCFCIDEYPIDKDHWVEGFVKCC